MHQIFRVFFILFPFSMIVLSGCSSTSTNNSQALVQQSPEQRASELAQLQQWQVKGKIAFLAEKTRNSFSLTWQVNELRQTQRLHLTSYLGINALQLDSNKNNHKIKVDGETYQGHDLEKLITSITGLTLPAKALKNWLKALPYHDTDKLIYQANTQLPQTLSSYYNNQLWQVTYGNYQQVADYSLPTKISIKKDNLFIKIAINDWSVN